MTPTLLLVAASGLARETLEAVRASQSHRVVGVLDDEASRWGTTVAGIPVLGPVEGVADQPETLVVLCTGSGVTRHRLAARLDGLGVAPDRYATVVHPHAVVAASARVGTGSILLAGCVLTADVTLGRHAVVMPNAVLTHDDQLGDYVTICSGAVLNGGVHVGAGAYLGAGCLVREQVRVGAAATVGMGAVVLRDVPSGEVWAGNPAGPLRASVVPPTRPTAGARS
jgi:sugar O-acyltransferase (sialic acid O-acetyltransferase NeuD family)